MSDKATNQNSEQKAPENNEENAPENNETPAIVELCDFGYTYNRQAGKLKKRGEKGTSVALHVSITRTGIYHEDNKEGAELANGIVSRFVSSAFAAAMATPKDGTPKKTVDDFSHVEKSPTKFETLREFAQSCGFALGEKTRTSDKLRDLKAGWTEAAEEQAATILKPMEGTDAYQASFDALVTQFVSASEAGYRAKGAKKSDA